MSTRYKGSILSSTAATNSQSAAVGIWRSNEVMQAINASLWPLGFTSDPYFNYVTALLHGDGTNGAQNNTFLDSSTNNFTITRNGNTTQGTFSPYGNNWSNYFDGSGDYLELASNSAFNMNTYCCLEAWVCYTTIGTSTIIVCRDSSYLLAYNFTAIGGTANKFVFTINNGSSWQAVSSTTTPVAGVWYHVVGIKDNTTLRIYINGTQENTAAFSGTAVTGSNVMGIGANQNTQNMAGYVSNTRLVLGASSGVLPYTSNFTSPTTPLTAVSGTVLLTCQSNRFIDNSSNNFTITKFGDTSIQCFSPFSPSAAYSTSVIGGSGYFDGSGDYLTAPSNAAFALGSVFTIEAWVYLNATPSGEVVVTCFGTSNGFQFGWQSGSAFGLAASGVAWRLTGANTATANSWNHVVVSRSGTGTNQTSIFINGVRTANGTVSDAFSTTSGCYIGSDYSAGGLFAGYMSNLRIVKGTAIYDPTQTTLTVPTAPLTAVSGTSALLNYTNAGIYDNAMMNDLETVGNAQVSTSVVKFGTGSMAFDGTGDGLSTPYNTTYDMGSGDFTYEWWMNPNSQPSQAGIFVQSPNAGAFGPIWLVYESGIMRLYATTANGSWNIANQAQISGTIATGTWTHFALTRSGGVWRSFVNGTQYWTITNSGSLYVLNTSMYIGIFGDGSRGYDGYLDDFRITKGYARYTANFTPPTAAFPNQ